MPEDESGSNEVTTDYLVTAFRNTNKNKGLDALNRFRSLSTERRATFLSKMIEFLEAERDDFARSWATSILALIETEESYEALLKMFRDASDDQKQSNKNTRFYGLKALYSLAIHLGKKDELETLCNEIAIDDKELENPRFAAKVILVKIDPVKVEQSFLKELHTILNPKENRGLYKEFIVLSHVLREFPLSEFEDDLRQVVRNPRGFREFRNRSIEALGRLKSTAEDETVRVLGQVLIRGADRNLRLDSLKALSYINKKEVGNDLITSIKNDKDAEIRLQAGELLAHLCDDERAVQQLVYVLMSKETSETQRANILSTLRRIDEKSLLSSSELSKELGSTDLDQVHLAERLLVELGGLPAYQMLAQKQTNIETMSELLSKSETLVNSKYQDMINKANMNFSFGLSLNIILAMVGFALFIIAIGMVNNSSANLTAALGTGATGVFSLVISSFVNNPRKQAKEDLGTVMNASIIYLGYLRQLNHIDTTFKQLYLEKKEFGLDDMKGTIMEIKTAMRDAVVEVQKHVSNSATEPSDPTG